MSRTVLHTRGWWKFSLADIKKIFCRSDVGSKSSHVLVVAAWNVFPIHSLLPFAWITGPRNRPQLSQCCINCHGPVNLQANIQSLNNQINVTHGPWCNLMLKYFAKLKCFFPLLTPRSMLQPGPTSVWLVYQNVLRQGKQSKKSPSFCMKTQGTEKRGGRNALSKIAPFPAPCLCALKVGEAVCTNA